jgi:hypothetical protein
MKKLYNLLIFVLGNAFIYFLCVFVYEYITVKLEKNYQSEVGLMPSFLLILGNIIFLIIYFYKLRFKSNLHWIIKKFGISLIPLGTLFVLSTYMKLDQTIILNSYYKTYEYRQTDKLFQLFEENDCSVIIISENYWSYSVPLIIEDCNNFDSIQVKISKGVFSGKSFTNDYKIIENPNCEITVYDEKIDSLLLLTEINNLIYKRCFKNSLSLLDNLTKHYPFYADAYLVRGDLHLHLKDYESALKNYYLYSILFSIKSSDITTKKIQFKNLVKNTSKTLYDIDINDFISKIPEKESEFLDNVISQLNLEKKIDLCLNKIDKH